MGHELEYTIKKIQRTLKEANKLKALELLLKDENVEMSKDDVSFLYDIYRK